MTEHEELRSDMRELIKVVSESTVAVSNLAIKVEHQSDLHESSEKRNDKRLDKIEKEAKEDREKSAASRKEMHSDISDIKERLGPLESLKNIISTISTKLIGSLILMFVGGGIGIFAIIKTLGAGS